MTSLPSFQFMAKRSSTLPPDIVKIGGVGFVEVADTTARIEPAVARLPLAVMVLGKVLEKTGNSEAVTG